ncbi:MAG: protein kinase family protein [Mobilitalea sp.]
MFTEINQKLEDAQQGMFRWNKIKSMLEELTELKETLEKKATELKEVLEKENIDVENLENKGLAHMFYSVFGHREEHVEKEQREALAAKLKYDQAVLDLALVKNQINQLSSEQVQYVDCANIYDILYAKKKELLMASNSDTAEKLMEHTEQLNISNNNRIEIEEAINAGEQVLSHLNKALSSLSSAEGWGTWDLLGGGLLTDIIKHSHIDEAKHEAEKTQLLLFRFRTELADVKINNGIYFEMDGFVKFTDFFFDGLIADWFMQSRIHDSKDSVNQVKNQVQQVLIKLNSMESREAAYLEQIEKEMSELIIKAE